MFIHPKIDFESSSKPSKHKAGRKRRAIAQTAAHLTPCRSHSCLYNLSPLVFSVLAVGVKTRWVQLQCSTAGGSSGRFATCQPLLHHVIEKTCGWQLATQASHRQYASHFTHVTLRVHTHKNASTWLAALQTVAIKSQNPESRVAHLWRSFLAC